MINSQLAVLNAHSDQDLLHQATSVFDLLDVSASTRYDYQARIGVFLSFIREHGLDRNSFLAFKRSLADRTDISVSTKNKLLVTARILLKELNRQGVLPVDVTQNIKSFSQSRKHKKDGLTDAEVARVGRYLQLLPRTPENARLKAIISLLTLQGLRQIEAVRLNVNDLHLARGIAYVQGKGRDDKEAVSLHPETVRLLRVYLASNKVADGALFTSNSNNSLRQRLTTRSVQRLVSEVFQKLGIAKSVHGLRHFYASKLIRAYEGDLLQVARYTRHSSISTLQVYFDDVQAEADLPRYYQTFEDVKL
ncbi:MAG TPA: tyrosine-type recombinase/integrase [Candidatus Saccharimonadales bacterium]